MKTTADHDRMNPGLQSEADDSERLQPAGDAVAHHSCDTPFPGIRSPVSGLPSPSLSHTDSTGRARMVDVSTKPDQMRIAKSEGKIFLHPDTRKLIRDNLMKKGDVLTVAEIAGIQAAKRTFDLIPLCHTINLTSVKVVAELTDTGVSISSEIHCVGQTGVEMEALTAVSVALLTIYDMCKAVDRDMHIEGIHLIEKTKHDITR